MTDPFGVLYRVMLAMPLGLTIRKRSEYLIAALASHGVVLAAASPPPLDVERLAADALLVWYDTTHGNEFGHDHHCPVPWQENPHAGEPDDRCTCGWSAFQRADIARAYAAENDR